MTYRVIAWILLLWSAPASTSGALRAGAARVEITPAKNARLQIAGYDEPTQIQEGVHDPLHIRALVLDDGKERAAIVACEILFITNLLWQTATRQVAEQAGIRPENLMLMAVHTHGAPVLETTDGHKTVLTPYATRVVDAIVEAVRQASGQLRPARTGFGAGRANVNINRRARMADGGYWLGYNPDGPSDKTVGVLRVEDLSGRPIAVLINYAVHGVVMGPGNRQITADLPGATSRYVEQHLGDAVVALWTSGAAGDQNPIHMNLDSDFEPVAAVGILLGEEVLKVVQTIRTVEPRYIHTQQREVTCPGQRVTPGPLPRKTYEFLDADPVPIRLSVLMIGHTAVTGVSGEVLTRVWERLKGQSPFAHLLMVTLCNGYSGYLPDDAAYEQISYEIATSLVKKGCAENSIVDGLLAMMDLN
jgi:hypothetical protein